MKTFKNLKFILNGENLLYTDVLIEVLKNIGKGEKIDSLKKRQNIINELEKFKNEKGIIKEGIDINLSENSINDLKIFFDKVDFKVFSKDIIDLYNILNSL